MPQAGYKSLRQRELTESRVIKRFHQAFLEPNEDNRYSEKRKKAMAMYTTSNFVMFGAIYLLVRMMREKNMELKNKLRTNLQYVIGLQFVAIGFEYYFSSPLWEEEKVIKRKYFGGISDN